MGITGNWLSTFSPFTAVIELNGSLRCTLPFPPAKVGTPWIPGQNIFTSANGINDSGLIVGSFATSYTYNPVNSNTFISQIPVLWIGNQFYDLTKLAVSPDVKLTNAVAINKSRRDPVQRYAERSGESFSSDASVK